MSLSIMDRLRAGSVLGAEGYVFELERRGYIKAGPFVPEVVLDFPDAVRELHREFLRAGADVMVALTYYAHREKLRDVGREDDLEAMNMSTTNATLSVVAVMNRNVTCLSPRFRSFAIGAICAVAISPLEATMTNMKYRSQKTGVRTISDGV